MKYPLRLNIGAPSGASSSGVAWRSVEMVVPLKMFGFWSAVLGRLFFVSPKTPAMDMVSPFSGII